MKYATEPLFTKATYYKKRGALGPLNGALLHVSISASHRILFLKKVFLILLLDVFQQRGPVGAAAVLADGIGHVDNCGDDEKNEEDNETQPEQNSFPFVDAEVFEDDDAQKQSAHKSSQMGHVTDASANTLTESLVQGP